MEKTFLASIKKRVFPSSWNKSSQTSKTITEIRFFDYGNIPFKLYYDIASTGNLERLQISGEPDFEKCVEAWEEIVRRNGEENGSFTYMNYLSNFRAYGKLMAEYTAVKYILTLLAVTSKLDEETQELLTYVTKRGYRINRSNSQAYEQSLADAMRRSDNLITRIGIKQAEINRYLATGKKQSDDTGGFEALMANLIAALGQHIPDDVTLARYNEYRKIIKRKEAAEKKLKSQSKYGRNRA